MRDTSERQRLDFRFSISNDVPKLVEGDENRLVQILNNVLSNAIKFTPAM
jgi:signal transduction histidine kinase